MEFLTKGTSAVNKEAVTSKSIDLASNKTAFQGEAFVPKQANWDLRDGFKVEKVVSGLSLPVNLAFVPDPKET